MVRLTPEEHQAIADGLILPADTFIDGAYQPAALGNTFVSTKPGPALQIFSIYAHEAPK